MKITIPREAKRRHVIPELQGVICVFSNIKEKRPYAGWSNEKYHFTYGENIFKKDYKKFKKLGVNTTDYKMKVCNTVLSIMTGNKYAFRNSRKTIQHNNNIFVVDLDFLKKKSHWYECINEHPFIKEFGNDYVKHFNTLTITTQGGGQHLYFKYPEVKEGGEAVIIPSMLNIHRETEYTGEDIDILSDSKSAILYDFNILHDAEIREAPADIVKYITDRKTFKLMTKKELKQKTKNNIRIQQHDEPIYTYKMTDEMKERGIKFYKDKGAVGSYSNGFLSFTSFMKLTGQRARWEDEIKMTKRADRIKKNGEIWDSIKFNDVRAESFMNELNFKISYVKMRNVKNDYIPKGSVENITYSSRKIGYSKYGFIDLQTNYKGCNMLIKGDTGIGKSHEFKKLIMNHTRPFLSIVSRVSLADEQYNQYTEAGITNLKHYENDSVNIRNNDNVVTTIDSIINSTSNLKYSEYIVFVDEINSVIEYLISADTLEMRRESVFNKFITILKNCYKIVAVDADISVLCFKLFDDLKRKYIYTNNTFKHNQNVKAEEITDCKTLYEEIEKTKKYMVCCDSKKEGDILHEFLKSKGHDDIRLITSEHPFKQGEKLDDYEKIIYSPSIIYGLDSSMKRAVFCIYKGGSISPRSMIQQIARTRNIDYIKYHFTNKRIENVKYLNLNDCEMILKATEEYAIKKFTIEQDNTDLFNALYINYTYIQDAYNHNKFLHFTELMRERGIIVKENTNYLITENKEEKKQVKIMNRMKKDIGTSVMEERILNFDIKDVKYEKIKNMLRIPDKKLYDVDDKNEPRYIPYFIDNYILKDHFTTANLLFNTKTEQYENIQDYGEEFNIKIGSSGKTQQLFIKTLIELFNGVENGLLFKTGEELENAINPVRGLYTGEQKKVLNEYLKIAPSFRDRSKKSKILTDITGLTKFLKGIYIKLYPRLIKYEKIEKGKRELVKYIFKVDSDEFYTVKSMYIFRHRINKVYKSITDYDCLYDKMEIQDEEYMTTTRGKRTLYIHCDTNEIYEYSKKKLKVIGMFDYGDFKMNEPVEEECMFIDERTGKERFDTFEDLHPL